MNADSISDWILKPDVCRCCLSANGTWDLTAAYITDAGVKEIFADVLLECLNISLSHINEMGSSRLVCDLCVNHLRDASSFHHQVLRSDQCFKDYWANQKDNEESGNNLDSMTLKMHENEGIENNTFDDIKTCNNFEIEKKVNSKPKTLNIKKSSIGNTSHTPIAKLKSDSVNNNRIGNIKSCVSNERKDNKLELFFNKLSDSAITDQSTTIKLRNNKKQLSERKRVIVTCGTVLKETTACPFRHHKSWFQCFFCTQDFMEIDLLRNHTIQIHADTERELKEIKRFPRSLQIEVTNLECRDCQLALTDVDNMVEHFMKKHNKIIYKECIADYKVNSSPYTCHLCKREFHVFRSLTTHLNEHYANCICDVCGKSFLNSKRLKVHGRTHENGAYPCGRCGKVLKTKTSMSNHMESAHSKRIIKCQICFRPMKHYNDRIKHMSEAHNITHKFKCPFCDKEFNIKHYLATHVRQTHGNKNKKCAECDMAFITNHGLKKHMLKHTGERPFTCSVCSKSYARSYTLREHMRTHENDKRLEPP